MNTCVETTTRVSYSPMDTCMNTCVETTTRVREDDKTGVILVVVLSDLRLSDR